MAGVVSGGTFSWCPAVVSGSGQILLHGALAMIKTRLVRPGVAVISHDPTDQFATVKAVQVLIGHLFRIETLQHQILEVTGCRLMRRIADQIIAEVPGVVSVTYNIAPKPPSCIEVV